MSTITPLFRPVLPAEGPGGETWRAVPVRDGQPGKRLLLKDKDSHTSGERHARFLAQVGAALAPALTAGETIAVLVPMAIQVLWVPEACSAITRIARDLDPALRRVLMIELFGFPAQASMGDVEDAMVPLMPFFETFLAEPHPTAADFTVFANTNVQGVTRDLSGCDWTVEQAMRQLKAFWAAATGRRLYIYLQEVAAQGPVDLARRYQAAGMDGPFLGGETTEPRGIANDEEIFEI